MKRPTKRPQLNKPSDRRPTAAAARPLLSIKVWRLLARRRLPRAEAMQSNDDIVDRPE